MTGSIEVKVTCKTEEATDIASFELARLDGAPLPRFSAGSHIDVHIPGGLTRQYSLCNDSTEQHRYRIAVLRDPASRGGSTAMHDTVKEGDVIRISTPRNHFPLQHAKRSLLFAGGIGVTPLLCMAQRLAAIDADFTLHYCTRSEDRTAFIKEIEASDFSKRVKLHFDAGPPINRLDIVETLAEPAADKHLYVCGPGGFIDFVINSAKNNGWGHEQIHLEYFANTPQDTSGNGKFEVRIASTGKTYSVEAGQSITRVLQDNGIDVLTSCEQGVCGTCITRVLEGEPDHRDLYFTDEEKAKNDQFTPCCSRSKSKLLVLDL
ncbi:PDR/VanB family oxidoreductase [Ottowia thiooxydans]|uniref:PDR/VanB family oxidoreductase n=1 Tax=Ottowia thiooxydans TaxID=219182 RepID=UPI000404FA14|nr:PDR/VanB family oxidoreductase [Ottowia thiooxydans]